MKQVTKKSAHTEQQHFFMSDTFITWTIHATSYLLYFVLTKTLFATQFALHLYLTDLGVES